MATVLHSRSLSDVAKASNEFSFHLYKTLSQGTESSNTFFSPISITTALSMTLLGARGETADQMRQVLRVNHIEETQLHQSFQEMNNRLYTSKADSYILKSANRLFSHQGFSVLDEFRHQTKTHYGSELATYDFITDGANAAKTINSWVEGETNGNIKDLIQEINPLTRLILVNAIYFKGKWMEQFDERDTRKGIFHVSSNEKLECDLMFQETEIYFTYDSTNQCKVLDLPYKGNDLSMLVVLPDAVDGLAHLESKLSASLLKSWIVNLEINTVQVWLPKFSFSQMFCLNDALIEMGMGHLFDEVKADLSGISETEGLYVGDVLHKAFIEVNEEGSEAAAATAVEEEEFCLSDEDDIRKFRADHPFLFIIRDRRTQVALFMGRMVKPQNGNGHDKV